MWKKGEAVYPSPGSPQPTGEDSPGGGGTAARTAPALSKEQVEGLILTKPRRGYLLTLTDRDVFDSARVRPGASASPS